MSTPLPTIGSPGRRGGPGGLGPAQQVGAGREAAARRRRRPGMWAAGLALVAAGGLAAAALVGRAGDRVEVLALARTVPIGQTISEADLIVARLPADPAVQPIPATDRAQVVGKVAAARLAAGSLLTAAELTDTLIPGADEQLVGVTAKPGQLPARGLAPGDQVLAVPVPGDQADATATGAGTAVPGQVVQVGPADADGAVTVDLVVGKDTGPRLAALASTGRLALILLPAGAR
jgi:SAF domain